MAALSVTAANVVKGSDAQVTYGIAGATITAGQTVYLDSSDSKFKLADADSATAAVRACAGIALNGAADGQPLAVQTLGDLGFGAILTAGLIYCLGDVAGGIIPSADLSAGERVWILGIAKTTSTLGMVNKGFDVGT